MVAKTSLHRFGTKLRHCHPLPAYANAYALSRLHFVIVTTDTWRVKRCIIIIIIIMYTRTDLPGAAPCRGRSLISALALLLFTTGPVVHVFLFQALCQRHYRQVLGQLTFLVSLYSARYVADMELGHWVTRSMGHLGHLSRPAHQVIILTRCETRVFPVHEKMPKTQNAQLKC